MVQLQSLVVMVDQVLSQFAGTLLREVVLVGQDSTFGSLELVKLKEVSLLKVVDQVVVVGWYLIVMER